MPTRLLRIRRPSRRLSKAATTQSSPTDSGYGSVDDNSPETSPTPRTRNLPSLDGPGSWDKSDSSSDDTVTVSLSCDAPPLPSRRLRSASAPSRSRKANYPHTRYERNDEGLVGCLGYQGQGRPPDRFVPLRDPATPSAERYRTTKPLHALSTPERLLRDSSASIDPFIPRRGAMNGPSDAPAYSVAAPDPTRSAGTVLGSLPHNRGQERQVSHGGVWSVGGTAPSGTVDDGHGHLIRSGTNARVFASSFFATTSNTQEDLDNYQGRVASALDIDRVRKILDFDRNLTFPRCARSKKLGRDAKEPMATVWKGLEWGACAANDSRRPKPSMTRTLPAAPFKVLDAPNLRDDFYCSVLAYSARCQTLAVGLGNTLYTWSEGTGVRMMHGRSDGSLVLKSIYDALPRFEVQQPSPVSCLGWRPNCTLRPSRSTLNPGVSVPTEELVVGDESGTLYYYAVEWPMDWEVSRDTWPGSMTLVAKISLHTQQICGLAWSTDGKLLASGGNDNLCCLFEVSRILRARGGTTPDQEQTYRRSGSNTPGNRAQDGTGDGAISRASAHGLEGDQAPFEGSASVLEDGTEVRTVLTTSSGIRNLTAGCENHRWTHGAAVKAIAFCPWRNGLVATGGGSNDKCIHFFHTASGSALATICVSAQVTSLIWSTTRREIAATFGYAQPEHPYRIAIFSWPDCRQVAAIPWDSELRALYAIPYPESPAPLGGAGSGRTSQEGCIVVASSDKSIKFHEVWAREKRATVSGAGMLYGSDILESLEGIDKEGDVIR